MSASVPSPSPRRPGRVRRAAVTVAAWAVAATAVLAVHPVAADAAPPAPAPTGPPAAIALGATSSSPVAAEPGDIDGKYAVLVVMDVSSSMNDPDENGLRKIDGAKQAVLGFIDSVPETTRMGLNTYPTPTGDRCNAGHTDISIAPRSKATMDRRVRLLSPAGETPTAEALLKAGRDLKAAGATEGVIVLVSDGDSTCEDPCAAAGQLAQEGIDITVNTVGFQIGEEGRKELECIADATAGTYFDAKDSNDLADKIAASTRPSVSLTLHPADQTVPMIPGSDNEVEITGRVTNTGLVPIPTVQAVISYDAKFSPGSARPRFRIANLAPGASREVVWRFRPLDEFADRDVHFTARALLRNAAPVEVKGTVRLRSAGRTDDAPAWLRNARHIAVLGDSYSSGEGAGYSEGHTGDVYDRPTDTAWNSCHRATGLNYAGALSASLPNRPKVSNLACSGAVVDDFWYSSKNSFDVNNGPGHPNNYHRVDGRENGPSLPSQGDQLQALATPPDLVLMTMGGNDFQFPDVVTECLISDFTQYVYDLPEAVAAKLPLTGDLALFHPSSPYVKQLEQLGKLIRAVAPDRPAEGCRSAVNERLDHLTPTIEARLKTVYQGVSRTVAKQRPDATTPLLIPAYPLPFPVRPQSCPGLPMVKRFEVPVRTTSREELNRYVREVNATTARAVDRARAAGHPVWFVDATADTFTQSHHTYCDPTSWLNRISFPGVAERILTDMAQRGRNTNGSPWLWVTAPRVALGQFVVEQLSDLLLDREGRFSWMSMVHPTASGYKAEAGQIVAWATRHPELRLPTAVPVDVPVIIVDGAPTVALSGASPATIAPGRTVRVTADGFAPGTTATITLHSDPLVVGSGRADAKGRVSALAYVDTAVPIGRHRLEATGLDATGRPHTVSRPVAVARPLPGWWWPALFVAAVAAVGALGAGGTWMVLRRRRRRDRPAAIAVEPG